MKPHNMTKEDVERLLPDVIPCYAKPTGCVREDGCEDGCIILKAYIAGWDAAELERKWRARSLSACCGN